VNFVLYLESSDSKLFNVRSHQRAPLSRASGALRGYATFCILLAKSRPDVGGGSCLPSLW